ncbi:flippase-like domain-containing protein [Acidobacteria bacterium AB60]|nr:flippase-like domain-containing protein [Acidobacteria bacterium AB60]
MDGEFLKKKQLIIGIVVLLILAAVAFWGRNRIHFDFEEFKVQVAMADWRKIVFALGCIYVGYVFRSIRWAWLLRHNRRVPAVSLLGTQVMGFTAVALIGRVADLVRPYLVAKKTGMELSTQIAVYIVERLSDAGAMALIFSAAIVLTPAGSMPHPELVKKAGYWGLAGTAGGALFLTAVRLAGNTLAAGFERVLGTVSKKMGLAVGHKIRTFQTGLDTIRSFSDFAVVVVLSLGMWVLITAAYLNVAQAFVHSPQLAGMSPANCVLLMVVSGGASVVQLPVIGWFSQIGLVAAAITGFFGVRPEAATACAAMLLIVTFLGIVPVGLIWAQVENVSLRKVTSESEVAEQGGV